MIAQHFIRSPSLKEKLEDRYAGLELVTGLIIVVVVILTIFLLSTTTSGRVMLYILMLFFVLLLMCCVIGVWIHKQKAALRRTQISGPLSKGELFGYGYDVHSFEAASRPPGQQQQQQHHHVTFMV